MDVAGSVRGWGSSTSTSPIVAPGLRGALAVRLVTHGTA
jgi:hypothetical protein